MLVPHVVKPFHNVSGELSGAVNVRSFAGENKRFILGRRRDGINRRAHVKLAVFRAVNPSRGGVNQLGDFAGRIVADHVIFSFQLDMFA